MNCFPVASSRFEGLFRFAMKSALLISIFAATSGHAQTCIDGAATPSVCAFDPVKNAAAKTRIKGVLLMDWTSGGHTRTYTQNHMLRLAQKYGFKLDRSQSLTYITDATLQGIDLIVFNNGDQDPLQNAASLAAVRKFIEVQGKGILVIHAGAAYIPCNATEDIGKPDCRWIMRGLKTQFWIINGDPTPATIFADSVMVGEIPPRATGISAVPATHNHGRKNPETRNIFENLPTNAGAGLLANRPYVWEGLGDEWYNYRNIPRLEGERVIDGVTLGPINILLSLDESSVASNASCSGSDACKNQGTFGDRPVSWTRKMGNGLFAYQSAGHSNVYTRTRTVSGITVNDSLIEKYNWRLMKYLARDFVGCMTPGDPNYNPEASVAQLHPGFDPEQPCRSSTPVRDRITHSRPFISTASRSIRVTPGEAGEHTLRIVNVRGQPVYSGKIAGDGQSTAIDRLEPGIYFLRLVSAKGRVAANRIELF